MSSSWSQNKDLRNMAIKYITPVAIEYTNGSFISSITELKKKENYNDEFYKYIRDEIQGTCNVEAEILNTINRKGSYFIFIAKINTKPLQEHIKTQISTEYGLPENSIVINTLNNFNTIKNLNDIGIPKDEIKKIELEIKQWKDLIELENERIKSIERDFILTGDKKINAIYNEIDQLNQEFENKSTRLQALLEQATTTKFNPQNLNGTITNALYDIDLQISNLNTRILQLEEERLFANYQVMVTTSGDYFSEVANEAIQAQNELVDTYTKVENYVRIAELENDVYTKNVGAEQQYQRYSDKIWIFPEPGEGDYFRITIVVKFTLEEPGKKLNWW
jgi:predicted RNase H-like nuclease (RuvC/YqgF family)